jgi:hypothetical protein
MSLLGIEFYNLFNLLFMRLSQSHYLGHGLSRLTWVGSCYFFCLFFLGYSGLMTQVYCGCFLCYFFIDFFSIYSFNIRLIEN